MKTFAVVATSVVTLFAASFAVAQDSASAERTYREIEATLGSVPTHVRAYPESAVAGAWAMFKGLELEPENNALEPKVKSLINLAVAAQIPCDYCIWLETKMARDRGATDEEIAEAVAHAGYVRHWSAVLNGLQIDVETFKAEFGGDFVNSWVGHNSPVWGPPQAGRTSKGEETHFESLISCPCADQSISEGLT